MVALCYVLMSFSLMLVIVSQQYMCRLHVLVGSHIDVRCVFCSGEMCFFEHSGSAH